MFPKTKYFVSNLYMDTEWKSFNEDKLKGKYVVKVLVYKVVIMMNVFLILPL